ncbi:hypothetical protein PI124_g13699 [Phytophthora idaei]|nr:hypothetical protein PI125_g15005 [Phytophthora idaei]KAG3149213.1 hypothetical protein PI126_g12117 [Phytophthora idaei]KAG3241443.1 hypothetical protein PI124_g13699 [Phytophthora idaei]
MHRDSSKKYFADRQLLDKLVSSAPTPGYEAGVALLFRSLKETEGFKDLGGNLLEMLYDAWVAGKVGPDDIKAVLKVTERTPKNDPRILVYGEYTMTLVGKVVRGECS